MEPASLEDPKVHELMNVSFVDIFVLVGVMIMTI